MADYDSQQREDEILKEFRERFNRAKEHSNQWRQESKELYDMAAGHQWTPEDEAALKEKYKNSYPMVTFNLSDKYKDAVTGMQINNRQEIRYFPRRRGVVKIDEYATGIVKWNRDQCEAEDEETDTFHDVFWVGMGWVEHFLDDSEEVEGWIAQERRDPLEMYWDWAARKKNLADRRFQIRIKPFTPTEYEEFFDEELGTNIEGAGDAFSQDGTPQIIPIPHDYGTSTGGEQAPRPIFVADYQWYELDTQWTVDALFPGDQAPSRQKFKDNEWKRIKPVLDKNGVQYKSQSNQTRCYYRCWIGGDGIKLPRGSKAGDKVKTISAFTFEAITGKRDRNSNTWYGMGRAIRDPQMWVNKFFSNILYTLSVNAKGGLLAEESAFEDQRKAEQSWADPAAITYVADGAIAGEKIMPKPAAQYPQGMDRLMEFALNALPMTSGLSPEILGLTDREQPNILEESRKRSSMAIIAWAFDAMRRYYKRSGKLMLTMVRDYLGDGQLIKIVGKEGAQYVPLVKQKLATDYDIVVDESPTSTNMQERVWAILVQMIDLSIKAGMPVPPEVIDYSPMPEDLKQAWKQKLGPNPQQQMQQQIAQRGAMAKVAVDESKAKLNEAQAQETVIEAQVKANAAPIEQALQSVEAVRKSAEAGVLQAGG